MIEMVFGDMSTVLKPSDSYAMVLTEAEGGKDRKLAVIIGAPEAQAIKMAQIGYRTPRPFTHELLMNLIYEGGMDFIQAVIYDVKDGIYYTHLYMERQDGSEYEADARTTDVVALSMRAHFPIYIEEELLERERLRNISPDGSVYTLTVNAVSTDMLEQALAEAVKQEDYERASQQGAGVSGGFCRRAGRPVQPAGGQSRFVARPGLWPGPQGGQPAPALQVPHSGT